MSETEIEIVAKAAYEQHTSRADWGAGMDDVKAAQWNHWRGIARACIAALDRHRQESLNEQQVQQAHIRSELSELAHSGYGS